MILTFFISVTIFSSHVRPFNLLEYFHHHPDSIVLLLALVFSSKFALIFSLQRIARSISFYLKVKLLCQLFFPQHLSKPHDFATNLFANLARHCRFLSFPLCFKWHRQKWPLEEWLMPLLQQKSGCYLTCSFIFLFYNNG